MDHQGYTELISDKATIFRYFQECLSRHLPLIISSEHLNSEDEYSSLIIKQEIKKARLIIKPPTTVPWINFLKSENTVDIFCHLPQCSFTFSSLLLSLDNAELNTYCSLNIPQQIYKKQVRSHFRVSVPQYMSRTTIELEKDNELEGTCRNISVGGALFQFEQVDQALTKGRIVNNCHLYIDDVIDLSCKARVCQVAHPSPRHTQVGLNFLDLDPAQLRAIMPAVNKLERRNIASV